LYLARLIHRTHYKSIYIYKSPPPPSKRRRRIRRRRRRNKNYFLWFQASPQIWKTRTIRKLFAYNIKKIITDR
jgi:hypothetical protein